MIATRRVHVKNTLLDPCSRAHPGGVRLVPASLTWRSFHLKKIDEMVMSPGFLAALPIRPSHHRTALVQRTRPRHLTTRRTSNQRFVMSTSGPNDLLIVGAGTLGRLIGVEWRQAFPTATVIGETRTDASHPLLLEAGITPAIAGTSSSQFPRVVFCAPPSGSADYPGTVAAAAARVAPGGRLAFTSSGSVHGKGPTLITERTPVVKEGRALVLAEAESNILAVPEGRVVRLAGLYTIDRGAHSYWLKRGSVSGTPDGLVNLVHYRDAAKAVVAVLKAGPEVEAVEKKEGRIYLASAGRSVSRRDICEVALKHPKFTEFDPPVYGDEAVGKNRTYDNSWTRQTLGWKPEFESFDEFMEADAKRGKETASVETR